MIMKLPNKFNIRGVEVKDSILKIYKRDRFEDLMYELTYATKHCWKCVYCGKKLNKKNRTLDHGYPRDAGGISITNNLYPSCANCNSQKSNLTQEEFWEYTQMTKKEKKRYIKEIEQEREKMRRKTGFKLPKKWVEYLPIGLIKYEDPSQYCRGKKYCRIVEFYYKYKKIPKPIIVDKNYNLLDGYNVIVFSREFGIKKIPTIVLENVELVTKSAE